MYEIRATEEAKTVEKACSYTRGYVLQCHLKTTCTHLTTDNHSYTLLLLLKNVFVHKIYLF